ncbi:DUF6114 domain-containing protein [Bacillus salipaludis]|uniref:DUF6114 domain-containing protein n=1 Tax=Bacillus salipaludis TaxID=2547811 RepID=A0AA90QUA2_9BACI|nr:DUF6114 domain-containing protein [Bacillus salipaludis]MDQ6596719.1 DUF6114 domain-containing protein [Bacillus salipaludis]
MDQTTPNIVTLSCQNKVIFIQKRSQIPISRKFDFLNVNPFLFNNPHSNGFSATSVLFPLLGGGLTLLMGVLSYIMPKLSSLLGILAIFSSVLSIMGALGGILVGTILGIIGGAICIAWKPEFTKAETIHPTNQDEGAEKEVAFGKESLPD